ncbi:hypothetical protein L209DRAFT_758569 [Thermothelomyces heterothallicus CBS 203.75]
MTEIVDESGFWMNSDEEEEDDRDDQGAAATAEGEVITEKEEEDQIDAEDRGYDEDDMLNDLKSESSE